MSARPAPSTSSVNLTEAALRHVIASHGRSVATGELAWLGGILGKVVAGYALTQEQTAKVSAIRGSIARWHRTMEA